MMTILPLLVLALLSGSAFSCDCDDCCWQKCFSEPGMYSAEYARLHSMVTTLIAQKQTLGTGGTAFLFDFTTADPNICKYQKNLASLIALTMPVEDVCNPFFFNKNAYNFAWYAWSWQCKNRCQAATTISNSGDCIPAPPYPTPNWINGGCILADHAFNNPGLYCSKNVVKKREMVVALANSPFKITSDTPIEWDRCINPLWSGAPHPGFTRAVVAVENADISQTDLFASNPLLSFDFKNMDGPAAQAAIQQLLKCINANCCNPPADTPVKREAQMGNATILRPDGSPMTMTEEEAEQLIQEHIDNIHMTTTTTKPPPPCKQNKRCAKKKGKCSKTPPSKNCKAKGWCSKKDKCKCYICKR